MAPFVQKTSTNNNCAGCCGGMPSIPSSKNSDPYEAFKFGTMGNGRNMNYDRSQFSRDDATRSVRTEHIKEMNRYGRPSEEESRMALDKNNRGGVIPRVSPPDMELKGMLPPVNMSAPGQFPG